ncbi:MAG: hypothetical protein CMM01_20495 [Rhodopirellula sp.]|nr:hypothetical protein [Rhodopirellula sp.]
MRKLSQWSYESLAFDTRSIRFEIEFSEVMPPADKYASAAAYQKSRGTFMQELSCRTVIK